MAQIKAEWARIRVPNEDTGTWTRIRRHLDEIDNRYSRQAVYVIRTAKPIAITYPRRASPVMYIGEGNFDKRFRSHVKNWIAPLAASLPILSIEVYIAEIKVRNNSRPHRDVEADLLHHFAKKYGAVPLMNRQSEYHNRKHEYPKGFYKPLYPESGAGYKWAISPLISNLAYPASLKGLVK